MPADQIGHIWRRYMGWLALAPLPFWLHLTGVLLPPEARARQRLTIRLTYLTCAFLSLAWITGRWGFTRATLLPPELVWPVSLLATAVGAAALWNVVQLRRRAADRTLRTCYVTAQAFTLTAPSSAQARCRRGRRPEQIPCYTLLGVFVALLAASVLYWPVIVNWLALPWSSVTRLSVGDSLPLLGVGVLAYAVAYHNAFMAGRWVRRDFYLHAVTVGAIATLYLLTLIGSHQLALTPGFDVPTLTFVSVVGLALCTHFLADRARGLLDRLFFLQVQALPGDMRNLMRSLGASGNRLEMHMSALVGRLAEMTGASSVCVALREGDRLIVRASTEPERLGRALPAVATQDGPAPLIGP